MGSEPLAGSPADFAVLSPQNGPAANQVRTGHQSENRNPWA
jgi:hypothetical protein